MQYEVVTIVPVSGVDPSMLGYSVCGWTVEAIRADSNEATVVSGRKDSELFEILLKMLFPFDMFNSFAFTGTGGRQFYALVKANDCLTEVDPLINAMRVFKSSKIGFYVPIIFKNGGAIPQWESKAFPFGQRDAQLPLLSFTEKEKNDFRSFVITLMDQKNPEIIDRMLLFLQLACAQMDPYIGMILLVTIFEMVVDDPNNITKKMTFFLAAFLGRSKEESESIARNFRIIYDARSKFLHAGALSANVNVFEMTFELARRLIANLMLQTESIESITEKLHHSGFGTNPYSVKI